MMDWYQVFGGIKVISIENMVFHYPIESDDPKVIDAPNFIFDSLVRMPARWLCSNPGFQYSSAGGEGLLIQTLFPNQSQSLQIHQTAHMPLTTRLVPLQSTGCRLQRKYVGKFARNPLQAGSEILLGNGKLSRGKFWFCQHGEGGQGAPLFFLSPYLHWWHRDKEMWKYLADEGSEELGWEFRFLAEICGMRN